MRRIQAGRFVAIGVAGLLAVTFSGEAASAQTLPFEGRWATDADRCSPARQAAAKAPITITATSLAAPPAMTCNFTSVLPGGASFRVEATCQAMGRTGHEFFTFAVLGERLYWTWGERTGVFDRCPG
ncbi:MAG: hypothetical protein JO267_09235 [Alphaproteobacteria bacterium]|nr:hypothetical protein [Alphaproteobacteria bacterium]